MPTLSYARPKYNKESKPGKPGWMGFGAHPFGWDRVALADFMALEFTIEKASGDYPAVYEQHKAYLACFQPVKALITAMGLSRDS